MKILRLGTYYYPEITAGNHLLDDLYEGFAKAGFDVEVYVPVPSRGIANEVRQYYKKRKLEILYGGKVILHRFSMIKEGRHPLRKALKYFLCNIAEFFIGIRANNVDIVFSSSTPPTQGMISALVAKKLTKKYGKKVPFVYNLQDVFPDSLINTGMTKEGSLIWKIGRKIENFTYNNSDKIIVISEAFKKNIMEKGVPEEKIEVISNWIDLDLVHPIEKKDNNLISEFKLDPTKFIVLYAGNFGAAQGADIVLQVAAEMKDEKHIQFVIFGGGTHFEDAKKKAEELENVFIHNLMPQDRISEVYSLGDVALITCKAGTGNAGMPSKTWSIMACNTPIIASFDTDSDLAEVIKKASAGECVTPESVNDLEDAILRMYRKDKHKDLNLRSFVKQNASKTSCVEKYIEILKEFAEKDK